MRLLTFKEGDVVIQEGDQGNELYIVDEGNFKCTK
jgi:CRP-like cAMP-binding protein